MGGVIATAGCLLGLVLSFVFKMYITQYYLEILFEPLFMIGFLWFGYDVLNDKWPVRKFPDTFNVLFFVYCMHLIVLCYVGGVLRYVLGYGPTARLVGYFALFQTFWGDVWVANLTRKYLPRAFTVLAGGR